MTILLVVFAAGYMKPVCTAGVVLKEQLVKTAILQDKLCIPLASGFVRQTDIGCFTCEVLRVGYSSYELVESGTAVAGVDDYGLVGPQAEGF